MKLLLVAATEAEIAPTLAQLFGNPNIRICLTGVGVCAATFQLTRVLLSEKPDAVIAAGIAGSFDHALPLGTVARVTHDRFGDLGAEDKQNFLSLPELGLAAEADVHIGAENPDFFRELSLPEIPLREAITVHTATGAAATAQARMQRYGPVLESMEGAAFHYVCRALHVPLLHLRAVSNYAEARNRPGWNIPLAVQNLNHVLTKILSGMPVSGT